MENRKLQLEDLLLKTQKIINYKKEKQVIRGESFNVFSILKMENMENNTHSAFIKELLNPKGTHYKGDTFLKLFLQTLNIDSIDIISAQVKTEYHIGKRDDEKKTGGRIDIYIWDKNFNGVSLENKIDAKDQNTQIERYCNYNKSRNTVFYLTKKGGEPNIKSKGDLVSGSDFFLISYEKHIIDWLQMCLKESTDSPILRESIKQYIVLIKKITNTMDNKEQKELTDLILKYSVESAFISSNYNRARQQLSESIRKDVYKLLNEKIGNQYIIERGNKTNYSNSQLWIKPLNTKDSHLYFGVETFSGDGVFKDMIIGVFNGHAPTRTGYADVKGNVSESKWWINIKRFDSFNQVEYNFQNPKTISKIYSDHDFRIEFVNEMVRQIQEYLDSETDPLVKYINRIRK